MVKQWIVVGCLVGLIGCSRYLPPPQASLSQQQKDKLECSALAEQAAGPPGTLLRGSIVASG